MSEPKHTYPSRHPPGSYWATDIGWEILDAIKPGIIPEDVRAYLCGRIAGYISGDQELADRFIKWVEQYTLKVCPPGCLPLPAQEREIALFAEIVRRLQEPRS